MKVLITGASGFIGSALAKFLAEMDYQLLKLVRRRTDLNPNEIFWDPDLQQIDSEALEGIDIVIHLAGENLAGGRWTEERKKRIVESRVKGTQLISQALANLKQKPKLLISASAVGYYGDQGNSILTEKASKGAGFLADLCEKWEAATQKAVQAGIRVVNFRMGIVLDPNGGALKMMLFPFKWGMGGKIGSGHQYMSWIALEDVLKAVFHIIKNGTLKGPVNIVSPNPVTNEEFTKALGHALHRPTFFSVPTFALHGLLGDAAEEVLLVSTRVIPEKLVNSGFIFQYPTLDSYLQSILQNT